MQDSIVPIYEKIKKMLDSVDLQQMKLEKTELEQLLSNPSTWKDKDKMKSLQIKLSIISENIEVVEKLLQMKDDLNAINELWTTDNNHELENELSKIREFVEKWYVRFFMKGKYDANFAIFTIKAGQGGTEACDWVGMLYRMYVKYAKKNQWQVEIIDEDVGDEAGYNEVTFVIKVPYAYGLLKHETGTHRLVRISPFNAQGLRQTSFASVLVMPLLDQGNVDIEIKDEDIEFKAVRAGGPGGQYVNKTASAVRLTHNPTGIVVTCSMYRDQHQNKKYAMKLLQAKLAAIEEEKRKKEYNELQKGKTPPSWGTQIRNYVLHPYKLVKDLRTKVEESNANKVLDGGIDKFVEAEVVQLG